ncbi:MAG: prepilin-type N-terminal cleavage/methylation domain-containing protein [Deltaproteobacteria bacterium]|jgi:prepilin-type N-terminal cleavage/methylation domain-containing protein|nr:prepilin-type N-terminal cleavage/methylation domain-containing protein [Deltaproteobacteria bacterium]
MKDIYNLSTQRKSLKAGFTVMELIVVMAIIVILSSVVYTNLEGIISDKRVRGDAVTLESYLQKGRQRATHTKRPNRVVINCSNSKAEHCLVSLQAAVIDKAVVSDWTNVPNEEYSFHEEVKVAALKSAFSTFDGSKQTDNVYYVIFMPDQSVYCDPKPFDLFIYYGHPEYYGTSGYKVSVGFNNSRISLSKEKIKI